MPHPNTADRSAGIVPYHAFNLPYQTPYARLAWLYAALFGPCSVADLAAATGAELHAAQHACDRLAEYRLAAFAGEVFSINPEFMKKAPLVILKNGRPFFDDVDNLAGNVDNSVDNSVGNPVDNGIFSACISSSSRSVSGSVTTENEENENTRVKNAETGAKNRRGRPPGPKATGDDEFDALWRRYSALKDSGKKQAFDQFRLIRMDRGADWPDVFAAILAGLDHAKKTTRWRVDDGRYIPDCYRWLRDERWDDRLPIAPEVEMQEAHDAARAERAARRDAKASRNGSDASATGFVSAGAIWERRTSDFGDADPSPALVELLAELFAVAANGSTVPGAPALDAGAFYLVRTARPFAVSGEQARNVRNAGYAYRLGRRPASPDEWDLELALREAEAEAFLVSIGAIE